ncbi:MAG: hypothetical protein QOI77_709 [Blastocatellia bacterium]|nr:hypothetical protein [Blastocatellia bacterium]
MAPVLHLVLPNTSVKTILCTEMTAFEPKCEYDGRRTNWRGTLVRRNGEGVSNFFPAQAGGRRLAVCATSEGELL